MHIASTLRGTCARAELRRTPMPLDISYLALVGVFALLTWGFVRLCGKV
jgi:hypothetical protein